MTKLYIQSKSGDFNVILPSNAVDILDALQWIRGMGGYPAKYREHDVVVPFEEIEYVRKATDDEANA